MGAMWARLFNMCVWVWVQTQSTVWYGVGWVWAQCCGFGIVWVGGGLNAEGVVLCGLGVGSVLWVRVWCGCGCGVG